MILAHAEQAIALGVDDIVGIAVRFRGGDGVWLLSWNEAIDALIGKVGEVDDAVAYGIAAATVFMDASTNVKWWRSHIYSLPVRCAKHKHTTPTLTRASLNPVGILSI